MSDLVQIFGSYQGFYGVTPTGVIDGANDTFTLPNYPEPPESLYLFLDDAASPIAGLGCVFLVQGIHYNIVDGNTIVYVTPPTVGSTHRAFGKFGS